MSTQSNNPGSPAAPATQPPATTNTQGSTPPADGSSSPPNPPAPPTFSGTWFQDDDPQILMQWSLQPAQAAPGSSSVPDPGTGSVYQAQVRIYQLIFDTVFPLPPQRGSVVPFSVTDPTVGTTPFLQGSFVLSQAPLGLEVVNLRFPGFQPQNLTLFSAPTSPNTAGTGSPAVPPGAGGSPASGSSGSSQPAAEEPSADDEDTQA